MCRVRTKPSLQEMRLILEAMRVHILLLSLSCLAAAQSRLAFEVVSIKPVPSPTPATVQSGMSRIAFNVNGARVQISGYSPFALLPRAFRVELFQVDAPDFARHEYFEIQATLPAGATPEQVPEMLQSM